MYSTYLYRVLYITTCNFLKECEVSKENLSQEQAPETESEALRTTVRQG